MPSGLRNRGYPQTVDTALIFQKPWIPPGYPPKIFGAFGAVLYNIFDNHTDNIKHITLAKNSTTHFALHWKPKPIPGGVSTVTETDSRGYPRLSNPIPGGVSTVTETDSRRGYPRLSEPILGGYPRILGGIHGYQCRFQGGIHGFNNRSSKSLKSI